MNIKQQGFSLVEVLVSMFIASIAILGLVMLELTVLRSSQSSFNYTLATIEAHTLVDKVWLNLCDIKGTDSPDGSIYTSLYNEWVNELSDSNVNYSVFTGSINGGLSTFQADNVITVSWVDKNFAANAENDRVALNVSYPDLGGLCL